MSASTTSPAIPAQYMLPAAALSLTAVVRLVVVVDDLGGHLEPEVAVTLAARWSNALAESVRPAIPGGTQGLAGASGFSLPGALMDRFDKTHPRTSALISDLSTRSAQFLAGLRMGEDPSDVVVFGQALDVVHRELAAADRMRREWIAREGRTIRSGQWDVAVSGFTHVDRCPAVLPSSTVVPSGLATELATDFGLLVVICDGDADHDHTSAHGGVAVYRRTPDVLPDLPAPEESRPWIRDDLLSRMHLVDAEEGGSGFGVFPERSPALWSDPSSVARCQLRLLDASDEYSRLAASHARAEEMAALEQEARLAWMPMPRSHS